MKVLGLALLAAAVGSSGCGGSPTPHRAKAAPAAASTTHAAAKPAAVAVGVLDLEEQLVAKASEPISLKAPRQGPTRAGGEGVPFRVADLPIAVVPAPLVDKDAPKRVFGGELPPELTVKLGAPDYRWDATLYRSATITGNGLVSGTIKIGPWEGGSNLVAVPCGTADPWGGVVAARWEGIPAKTVGQKESPSTYTIVDGWFDRVLCRPAVVRRTTARLSEIVPDTLYAFRQCADEECSGATSVSLVIPSAMVVVSLGTGTQARRYTGIPYPRVTIPLRRGAAQSVIAQLHAPPNKHSRPQTFRTVSVEINQGTGDAEPVATAFVGESTLR